MRALANGLALLLIGSTGFRLEADQGTGHSAVPVVRAVRTPSPIVVDGRLDEVAWAQAPPASGFRQLDPLEGRPATEATELRVAYDDDALYVGLRLFDHDPSRIVRRLSRRDAPPDADRVVLYLDPRHDHLTGVVFQVSAAGVQADAVIYNDSWTDDTWDAVWESAVAVDEKGWTAELRIPFSELRFSSTEHQTWGVNVERNIQRNNESDWLELVPKKESGLASRMAHLEGLDGIRPHKHVVLLPYLVGQGQFVAPAQAGDPFNEGSRFPAGTGLDIRYGLTGNLTLNATFNPDFGQVEVDPAVVNLTEFETFFEEKRPFFIEGSQIFGNFGRNGANNFWGFNRSEPILFYSRRIGRVPQGAADGDFADRPGATTILGAAKLTGKTAGGWSVGILEAVTSTERARVEAAGARSRVEIEPFTNYALGRLHREFRRGGVGLLASSVIRDLEDPALAEVLVRRAHMAGVDGYVFLDGKKDWVVTGSLAGSWLAGSPEAIEGIMRAPQHYFQRPDRGTSRLRPGATTLSGWTGSLNLNRNSGNLQLNAALWGTSPGFESNDAGFNFRSDRWGGHAVLNWKKQTPDRLTRFRSVSLAKWYSLNFDGDRQGDGIHAFFNAQFLNYWSLGGNGYKRLRAADDTLTRGGPAVLGPAGSGGGFWVETDSRKRVSGSLESFYSTNEFGGWSYEGALSLQLKPSSSLSFSLGPSLTRSHTVAQWVTSAEDPLASATLGSRYVFADLDRSELALTTRLNWILSPRLSLQVYLQPLLSVGDYRGFKELLRPRSYDFGRYGLDAGDLSRTSEGGYVADPDGPGPAAPLAFDDPDFNFKSLRLNAVFRWEWRLGSTLYVVWTQNRQDTAGPARLSAGADLGTLLRAPADDVFLVKFAYRFSR